VKTPMSHIVSERTSRLPACVYVCMSVRDVEVKYFGNQWR